MDGRVQEILGQTKAAASAAAETAGTAVRSAGQRVGEMVEVAGLKVQRFELESQIRTLYQQVGRTVYDALQSGEDRSAELEVLMEQLDEKTAASAALSEQLDEMRGAKLCPACQTVCGWEDRYCRQCGAAL
ncbi:hypothetical protein D1159_02570 [Pseudoflavonifractor sp. 524-17]|uniref:hypothetical protein n=1 Tax=Pseudoflavonifractor sp. 524-17 TaxID=2304577 RepID=UPI00137A885D|nr:hypothetical protein [Pseudoflavonifractor sp. 524-17]NCE63492.1 hypothetical protein [Pseudoflavonifractor sp. 524-17]